jgi:hypothetical protein
MPDFIPDEIVDSSITKIEKLLEKGRPVKNVNWRDDEAVNKWKCDIEAQEKAWEDIERIAKSVRAENITHGLINKAVSIIVDKSNGGSSFEANSALELLLKKTKKIDTSVGADTIRIPLDAAAKATSGSAIFYALQPLEKIFENVSAEKRRTLFTAEVALEIADLTKHYDKEKFNHDLSWFAHINELSSGIIDKCPNSVNGKLFGVLALAYAHEDRFRSSEVQGPFEKLVRMPVGVGTDELLQQIDAIELELPDYLREGSKARCASNAIRKRRREEEEMAKQYGEHYPKGLKNTFLSMKL